jgi:hypothetical protein
LTRTTRTGGDDATPSDNSPIVAVGTTIGTDIAKGDGSDDTLAMGDGANERFHTPDADVRRERCALAPRCRRSEPIAELSEVTDGAIWGALNTDVAESLRTAF